MKVSPYTQLRILLVAKEVFGPAFWMASFIAVLATSKWAYGLFKNGAFLSVLLPVVPLLVAMSIDAFLQDWVRRVFNPALSSRLTAIIDTFASGEVADWNDGAARRRAAAEIYLLQRAVYVTFGRGEYARNIWALLGDMAERLRAQAGSWDEIKEELLAIRLCAQVGRLGSPACAPENDFARRQASPKRLLAAFWGLLTLLATTIGGLASISRLLVRQ